MTSLPRLKTDRKYSFQAFFFYVESHLAINSETKISDFFIYIFFLYGSHIQIKNGKEIFRSTFGDAASPQAGNRVTKNL